MAKKQPFDVAHRARRVLASQGKAPVMLRGCAEDEIESLAQLCGEDGDLVPGVREKFSEWFDLYLHARTMTKDSPAT